MSMVDLKSSGNQFAQEQQSIVPGAAGSHSVSDPWAAHSVNS